MIAVYGSLWMEIYNIGTILNLVKIIAGLINQNFCTKK